MSHFFCTRACITDVCEIRRNRPTAHDPLPLYNSWVHLVLLFFVSQSLLSRGSYQHICISFARCRQVRCFVSRKRGCVTLALPPPKFSPLK